MYCCFLFNTAESLVYQKGSPDKTFAVNVAIKFSSVYYTTSTKFLQSTQVKFKIIFIQRGSDIPVLLLFPVVYITHVSQTHLNLSISVHDFYKGKVLHQIGQFMSFPLSIITVSYQYFFYQEQSFRFFYKIM